MAKKFPEFKELFAVEAWDTKRDARTDIQTCKRLKSRGLIDNYATVVDTFCSVLLFDGQKDAERFILDHFGKPSTEKVPNSVRDAADPKVTKFVRSR